MSGFVLRKFLILKYFCTCIETFDYEIFVEIVTETGCRCENDCWVLCWKKLFPCFWKKVFFLRIHVSLCYKTHQTIHLEKNFWFWNIFVFVESVRGLPGFVLKKILPLLLKRNYFLRIQSSIVMLQKLTKTLKNLLLIYHQGYIDHQGSLHL